MNVTSAFGLPLSYDAVIVGARCAGAATAMLLARQGLRVLAVDRGRYGSDTLSTHALMRGAVVQLHRWGLLERVKAAGTPPARRASFEYGDETVSVPIKPRNGVDALYAPRRTVLDRLLVDAAREAGAIVAHGVRFTDLMRSETGRVCGIVIEDPHGKVMRLPAGIVIGADGLRSAVARLVGAGPYGLGRHATGVVYGYWSGLAIDGYRWCFRPGVAVGAIPTNGGQTCIFAVTPARRFHEEIRFDVASGYHRVVAECSPGLARSLDAAERVGSLHGFPGQIGFFRRSQGPGWALVGDAGYFKDPLTAHGITDALRDAELLARAVVRGSDDALIEYEKVRDEMARGVFDVTDTIASFEWDLETLERTHRVLNEEMAREAAAVSAFDNEPPDDKKGQSPFLVGVPSPGR
jgi:flavin-dependent dehydrogenase